MVDTEGIFFFYILLAAQQAYCRCRRLPVARMVVAVAGAKQLSGQERASHPTLGREICPALKIFKKNMPFELIEEFPCGSLEFFYALFVSTAFFLC